MIFMVVYWVFSASTRYPADFSYETASVRYVIRVGHPLGELAEWVRIQFAWTLSKDYERLPESGIAFIQLSMIQLMANRIYN